MNLATLLIIMWVTVLIGICFIVKRLNTIEEKIDKYKKELKKIEQMPAIWSEDNESIH